MKIVLSRSLAVALILFGAGQLRAQTDPKQSRLVPYDERADYCASHPGDSFNCSTVTVRAANGTDSAIGVARRCPGLSEEDQRKVESLASFWVLWGVNDKNFQKMGFCKLSPDEQGELMRYAFSRQTERAYYSDSTSQRRQNKRIYVSLELGDGVPEILASEFRNALRNIPDVEVTDGLNGTDFRVAILGFENRLTDGSMRGYVVGVELLTDYEQPEDSGIGGRKHLLVIEDSHLATVGAVSADLGRVVAEQVAYFNNHAFEAFRKGYPYAK